MSSPTRKKAARKSPAERAAEISDAAHELALEQGLSAVTLRAVAARVDVAPALVAHYEPDMQALIASTFASIVAAELAEVDALVAGLPTPRERLAAMLATLLDGSRVDVTVIWVEAWAMGRRNEALAASVRDEMDAWQAMIRGVVEAGVASNEFETDDPAAAAWQLLGMIDGLNAQALVRWGDAADRGSLISHAVEGMLGLERGALAPPSVG
ncbi:TetR family transcriptional regulator C-terminal domain-containing protein [Agromyces sp. SYSU K20354]|uniref:TetR/AcrR family transcriptional regulator n=1 Tax=Agromyces cavernae TaxID=2898659 RepID=UPI001E4B17DE|nr:TetR family transcriptional regulator C-terminal domain-containing protein [Agromyces cavernae]MCD2441383.1 TetR family transcriptional regulator C-terminal domain-containing protein [Agromyces cavernae]